MMGKFFRRWQRKVVQEDPLPEQVLELIARQAGISIETLRARIEGKEAEHMDSLELVELVMSIEDELH